MKSGQIFYAAKPSPRAVHMNIKLHNPSFVARQFGFSEALPTPYSLDLDIQLCGASLGAFSDLEYFLGENEDKRSLYFPLDFENSSFATPSFVAWWLEYYKSQRDIISICKEILVVNLVDVSLQKRIASLKTKGTHVREILQFEHFFKVKYNLQAALRVVRKAMEVFKRKKEQHEGQCRCAFEKARSINPFARQESYMTPFLFPPLLNALFGIADGYSNLLQGPRGVLYLHP